MFPDYLPFLMTMVVARKHCKREDIFEKIKRPLHKYEKDELKFPLDLDKVCAYISDKRHSYEFSYSMISKVFSQYHGLQKKTL